MEKETPPPMDPSPSASPQPFTAIINEEERSVPQREEVGSRQPIQSEDEPAMEGIDRLDEDSSIPIAHCLQQSDDDGGERRSTEAQGLQEKKQEVSTSQNEEGERDCKIPATESVGGEVMQDDAKEELIDVDGPHLTEELNWGRPQLVEGGERFCSSKEEEEEKVPIYEPAMEVVDQLDEYFSIHIDQCLQFDNGGEPRSTEAQEVQEKKPQIDGDIVSTSQEEGEGEGDSRIPALDMQDDVKEELVDVDGPNPNEEPNGGRLQLVQGDERVSSLKEEEEEKVPISEAPVFFAADDENGMEEKISEVDGPNSSQQSNVERPQLEVHSLKAYEEEDNAPIFEPAVMDEVMQETSEDMVLDVHETQHIKELNEEVTKVYSLKEALMEKEEKVSMLEGVLDGEGDKDMVIKEKISDFDGTEPSEQFEEEMLHEEIITLQEQFVGDEQKLPVSEPSHPIAEEENDEQKLFNEQMNEEKPHLVRKRKKVSLSQRRLVEEEEGEDDEKASSLQEEFAPGVHEESAEKDEEESDEKEDADEMDIDEGGPAMAAGKRTASKWKRGRPSVAQGRRTRAPPRPKEDEELCFICFDGGELVVCDHRGCPKVYHPSCVNHDEAYFKAKGHWSCGMLSNF